MKRSILFLLFYSGLCVAQAQDAVYQQPPKEAMAYREFRQKTTIPPYGLENVKKQIAAIKDKPGESGDEGISALPDAVYQSLSPREKFTYTMIHPEMYAQNCDINMIHPNEHKEIFGYLVSEGDEETWSQRQLDFLRGNRDSVMAWIRESANRSRRMGVNYKNALVEMDAWEMIPYIIDFYTANKKDKDLLTVLMLLMKRGKFTPFVQSSSYKKLYGMEGNHERALDYNKANENLIITRAQTYYKKRKHS
ncbi:hypothetical protein LL912_15680 [Niabella sp. CC-SYL272]|uniref:hypothetical protein n=1 Tax=Niabella agricola TaxID=2891571 RepID=UPI001F300906|nr:hypothetical protein [Niabella agricola]MCF3110224.1 hypothetical protein [Niabella agricola]